MIASRQEMAGILGVVDRSLKNYVDEGMPKASRTTYDIAACVQWYVTRERERAAASKGLNDLDLARQRKTAAEARMAEIELEQMEGSVIPLDVHEQRLEEIAGRLAAQCKGLDRFIAPVQRALTSVEAKGVLDDVSDALLASLRAVADDLDTIETPDVERSA